MLNSKEMIKLVFQYFGFKIERFDPMVELIPNSYNLSPYLPRVYKGSIDQIMYFRSQLEKVIGVDGDIVECGVSIGHGAVLFFLLSEYLGVDRIYYGFDSFEGFPTSKEEDECTPIEGNDYYSTPPEIVLKVFEDAKIPQDIIKERVRLRKGWFQETVPNYDGTIALLHLDCDLYDSYKITLELLYDKVAPDGLILFDEYHDNRWPGATKAIDNFFRDKPEKVQAHDKCHWKYYVQKM